MLIFVGDGFLLLFSCIFFIIFVVCDLAPDKDSILMRTDKIQYKNCQIMRILNFASFFFF